MALRTKSKKIAISALFVALGISLQAFEMFVPIPINIPGGKLGLANILIILLLPTFSPIWIFTVSLVRSLLGSLLLGGGVSIVYSVAGSILSSIAMLTAYKYKKYFSYIGIGIIGAVSHNIAQVIVACVLFDNVYIMSYLSILLVISVITGGFCGYAGGIVNEKKW